MSYISSFESLTRATLKDCLADDKLTFIVEKGDMGLAIGKQGSNLKRVENALKKTLKVVEFDEDVTKFIRNYLYPLSKIEVTKEGNIVTIKGQDTKTKSFIIGREKANLKRLISIVKRYFEVSDIVVI